mmetsp:Transcript_13256/g.30485  ORF Transcript_13256/g.30485 Transcript_13256/m.30485 type:complete len:100 (-) Transcript_13256:729-1028(-)
MDRWGSWECCASSRHVQSWRYSSRETPKNGWQDDRSGSGGACAVECEGKKESSERSEEICQRLKGVDCFFQVQSSSNVLKPRFFQLKFLRSGKNRVSEG